MLRTLRPLAALLLLGLLAPTAVHAQGNVRADTPLRPVTGAFAITNARVVVAPGRVLERATVVIRDGRIEAVGPRVAVPFDADVIAGDSLWVYAGFVDAFSYAGVPRPSEETEPFRGDPAAPPPERAGLTPDLDVRTLFNASDASIKALRDLGFGAAHVAPRTGALAGQGAVVLLREPARGEDAGALVLRDRVSLVAQMQSARGVYPATPMGVLAVFRERVENARRGRAQDEAFGRDPARAARPRLDPARDAFGPVLDGTRPLVFRADGYADGFRVLRAAEEAGLTNVAVAGVADAAPLVDRLRARRVSVFAPLALPDTVATDSLARALVVSPASPGGVSFVSDRRIVSPRDLAGETAALTGQRRAQVGRAEGSPAALARAGVPFAFATIEARPADVRRNLRRMIAAGLSPDAALGALTVEPARLLGLERQLGTVEAGKLANLVVTSGDYFAERTAVRHVFVEGVRYEAPRPSATPARPGGAAAEPGAAVQAVGTWDLVVQTPQGDQPATLVLRGAPGALTGTSSAGGETVPLESATLEGSTLTLRLTSPGIGAVTIEGQIDGETYAGTVDLGSVGRFPFSATRRPEGAR